MSYYVHLLFVSLFPPSVSLYYMLYSVMKYAQLFKFHHKINTIQKDVSWFYVNFHLKMNVLILILLLLLILFF